MEKSPYFTSDLLNIILFSVFSKIKELVRESAAERRAF